MPCSSKCRRQTVKAWLIWGNIAPSSKFIIRTICAIAAVENLTLYQFDVKGAFLMAPCKETVHRRVISAAILAVVAADAEGGRAAVDKVDAKDAVNSETSSVASIRV